MYNCGASSPVLSSLDDMLDLGARTLLVLDAPLGWPESLPRALSTHRAGEVPKFGPDQLFRRETDLHVARTYRKTPLDVGADRIARTAHWALTVLGYLGMRSGEPIPLAWGRELDAEVSAIEVYPAATLRAHGVSLAGYRKPENRALHRRLLEFIGQRLDVSDCPDLEVLRVDALDAGLCVVAALDFLEGSAIGPVEMEKALKEGWIWVRAPLET